MFGGHYMGSDGVLVWKSPHDVERWPVGDQAMEQYKRHAGTGQGDSKNIVN